MGIILFQQASFHAKTSEMENNYSQTIQFLKEYFFQSKNDTENDTKSPLSLINSYLGFMLGLSGINRDEVKEVKTIYQEGLSDLKNFVELDGKVKNDLKLRILGSAWFIAFSKFEVFNEEIFDLFEILKIISTSEVNFFNYIYIYTCMYIS